MSERVLLLVGTKKGGFIFEGDERRAEWSIRGPLFNTWAIRDMSFDEMGRTMLAGGASSWYGPAVWRSMDLGETWSHSSEGLTYGDEGPQMRTVWNVTAAHGAVYAGVDPAGLFRSDDGGLTWQHVHGLREHPTCPKWEPGNGGLCLHSIVAHPDDAKRMWVGISAVGVFETRDRGESWELRNEGVRADFMPETYPEFGQCVHKIVMAAGEPEFLYQQNHCGVYRTADGGRTWQEITSGLPSQFGFPMVAHPRDPATAWVIPLNGDDAGRYMPDGRAAVWRTHDRGESWIRSGTGLPQANAYLGVLREAMAVDRIDPAGVYFGTSTGQLFGSRDEGKTWSLVADYLPPIWSVEAVVLPDT